VILFISDIDMKKDNILNLFNRRYFKIATVYLGIAAFCILFDNIYALFGHGVRSAAMSYMFLYPLLCGTLIFGFFSLFIRRSDHLKSFRFSFNVYNSGIATLTVASAIKGVFEIAGTASDHLILFFYAGWIMLGLGVLFYIISLLLNKQKY
jgi:hypothetical protein